jgi:hypothetical protein
MNNSPSFFSDIAIKSLPSRLFNGNITSDDINTLLSNQQVSITQ